jgi:hypothetical protein
MSINRLSLLIQEKISKLNAGNLSMEELDELKEMTTELNERVIVLQYKAAETQLLRQAGEIIQHHEKKQEQDVEKAEKQPAIAPIKIDLGNFKPAEKPLNPVVETPVIQPEPVIEKVEKKPEPAIHEQKPLVQPTAQVTQPVQTPAPAKVSLVERMQKTKIQDLKTAIGLNQKFLFMNYLFEGENTSYNEAIEKLNAMPTIADARHYIRELAYVYNWNYEDENVIMFTEYVERRYL